MVLGAGTAVTGAEVLELRINWLSFSVGRAWVLFVLFGAALIHLPYRLSTDNIWREQNGIRVETCFIAVVGIHGNMLHY